MSITPEHAADLDQLKRALVALRKLRARVDELESARHEPIAIVGIGCRLPGDANSPAELWKMLLEGRDAIGEVPPDRWDNNTYWSDDRAAPGKVPSRYGGFLDSVDRFDPHFFGISPREARAMDPQQRLVLETAWEALEDARIVPASLAESPTGVFIGIGLNDYSRLQAPAQAADPTLIDTYMTLGNALCITANRLSYVLDLRGPSMAIDTACSSSLVAVHQACRSLRSGDCTMALVGGSNLLLAPDNSISIGKFLAPDGRCKFGDASADGYVRGEGVIMMVLMPLSRARAQKARIYALIRGSAVNQDGYSSGITVPNGVAQQAMLRAALEDARVAPEQIDYVEAHGTGTSLGDPIEIGALGAVLGAARQPDRPLLVGSVKANIGHLEAGAGIAGIAKAALALAHGVIPPSLQYTRPNPHIPFEQLHVRVATAPTPWPSSDGPRFAGVSSFGFGGTNAHVILEQAPVEEPAAHGEQRRTFHLLPLSAKDQPALRELAARYATLLNTRPELRIADLCAAAGTGRSHFAERAAFVAATSDELRQQLHSYAAGDSAPGVLAGSAARSGRPKTAFLFTGQGAQYAGMGRGLYDSEPVFRAAVDSCAELLRPALGRDVRELIFATSADASALLDQTAYTQPALFVVEYALAELWRSWGITPDAVIGHSLGEYAAACVAGVLSLEDALRLVAARGRLMGSLPAGGAMAAIFAAPERVRAALQPYDGRVAVAALNEPEHVVISGDEAVVEAVRAAFEAQGVKARRLATSHAFHSQLMDPILDEFEAVARGISYSAPRITLVSNLTGEPWAVGQAPDAGYWRRHLREPVRFAAGVAALDRLGCELFVELGPAPVLAAAGSRCLPDAAAVWAPSLRRNADDWKTMLGSLGALYAAGATPDWRGPTPGQDVARVDLPTYPFQRERYWFSAALARPQKPAPSRLHPLIDRQLRSPKLSGRVFETELSLECLPLLDGHRVLGTAVFPAAAYVEQALAAGERAFGGKAQLREMVVHQPLVVPDSAAEMLQIIVDDDGSFTVSHGAGEAAWRTHASGWLERETPGAAAPGPGLEEALAACPDELDREALYAGFEAMGMGYGPAFRGLEQIRRGEAAALGLARLPDESAGEADAYGVHPALLDAALQVFGALLEDMQQLYLPIGVEGFRRYAPAGAAVWSFLERMSGGPRSETIGCRLRLFDETGRLVAEADRIVFKHAPRSAQQVTAPGWLYELSWRPQVLAGAPAAGPGRWLLVDARSGLSTALAGALAARGAVPVLATPGAELTELAPGRWQVDLAQPSQLQQLVARLQGESGGLQGAVFLSGDDAPDAPLAAQHELFGGALHLAQALASSAPGRLALVTSGAQGADATAVSSPAQATLWGLGRVVARELPELKCVCIDLDPSDPEASLPLMADELLSTGDEDQVALRDGTRLVARLTQRQAHESAPLTLTIAARGTFDGLALREAKRPVPGPGEVVIRVRAAGLNFRDVLNVLGMYPGDAGGLGNECAGTVEAVGAGVEDLAPGDEVLAIAGDSIGTFAVARAAHTLPMPERIDFAQAATVPIAFATAAYGLRTLAGLKAGERVLIHAAAGGVGLAAVQIAQLAGAEVIGTAGSPEKRDYLRSLGVRHVFDSRSVAFADDVRAATGGQGVDVVLNSLTGEFIPASFGVLRDGGRFIEIGKRDIWTPEQVTALGRGIDYHIVYLGDICEREPALVRDVLTRLVDELNSGALEPLPLRRFPLTRAADAFRFMAQARHIGKLVLEPAPRQPVIRPDGAYLITGGLGGLGLLTADWLVQHGARRLALASRRAPTPEQQAAVAALQRAGAQVLVAQVDIADEAALGELLERVETVLGPLRGVVHAAGVLDDGPLTQQTWQRSARVLAPKVGGAWNLHRLTSGRALDWLVFYSAGAGLMGAPGQAAYAAANTFLDSLAQLRHADGLPALSVNWGVWGEAGMAAAMGERERERLAEQGLLTIAPADGLSALGVALGDDIAQIAALPADWSRVAAHLGGPVPSLLRELLAAATERAPDAEREPAPKAGPADLQARLAKAAPGNRRALLSGALREHAGRILGLAATYALDPRRPLNELGLDSLMAVELRNSLGTALGRPLPTTLLFDYPTLDALAGYLDALMAPPAPAAPEPATSVRQDDLAADLEQLSDEEAEALLLAELNGLKEGR